ncbi:hypothetical protein F5Y10DRAFT_41196 [Nemania abortiva]|nr:hypothetical protein F5Y10DRAFT_41196 [Nemania abortiva]
MASGCESTLLLSVWFIGANARGPATEGIFIFCVKQGSRKGRRYLLLLLLLLVLSAIVGTATIWFPISSLLRFTNEGGEQPVVREKMNVYGERCSG